jgi:hypothetical protein
MTVQFGKIAFRCIVLAFAVIGLYSSFGSVGSSKIAVPVLSLSEEQCAVAFPGLFREVELSVARGPFTLEKHPDNLLGPLEGKIKDGKAGKYSLWGCEG